MKKKILLICLLIPVILAVLEGNNILQVRETIRSIDTNSGTYRVTKYRFGIKISEVKTECAVSEYFEPGKEENWKTCSTLGGFFMAYMGSGTHGYILPMLRNLPDMWGELYLTEDEKRKHVRTLSTYWTNGEKNKALEYYNSIFDSHVKR